VSLDGARHGALLDKELEQFRRVDLGTLGTLVVEIKANGQATVEKAADIRGLPPS
jgi:hypothetical protein